MTVLYQYKKCPVCGIHYAVDLDVMKCKEGCAKHDSNRQWYCPNGHELVYRESDAEKWRKESEAQKARANRLEKQRDDARRETDAQKRKTAAQKGQVTRLKQRASAGVCPCCNRQFRNLLRHMDSKHPTFSVEAVAAE